MNDFNLTERKRKVLQALVDSYINSVEPISSSAIQAKYLPEVSTATIRSELSMLEEMGYVTQPHISSGRVPSTKAYRYYVDNFMNESDFGANEVVSMVNKRFESVQEIVKESAKIISDATNYTSMLMVTNPSSITVRDVKLIDMFDGTAMVLIITNNGVIKNKEITLNADNSSNYIEVANGLLTRAFAGKSLADILNNDDMLDKELREFKGLYEQVIALVNDIRASKDEQLYVEGTEKIFDYPEYQDVENVRNFMSVVSHKEKLVGLMSGDGDIEYSVKIGSEDSEELHNMAFVSAKYKINGKEVGQVGVIGPERMNYKKVISVLRQMGKLLDENEKN